MIFVDPAQEEFMEWLRGAYPRLNVVTEKHRLEQMEWGCQWDSVAQARAARIPNVPISLITAAKPDDVLTRALIPRWLDAHAAWLKQFPQARHIISTQSGHDIVQSEPGLVIEAIRTMHTQLRRDDPSRR